MLVLFYVCVVPWLFLSYACVVPCLFCFTLVLYRACFWFTLVLYRDGFCFTLVLYHVSFVFPLFCLLSRLSFYKKIHTQMYWSQLLVGRGIWISPNVPFSRCSH
jgi:hypothetical protein